MWPKDLLKQQIAAELNISLKIFQCVPQLKEYPLIRFDYGPDCLLNEIEILCDLFGGPGGTCKGVIWQKVKQKWSQAYINLINQKLQG